MKSTPLRLAIHYHIEIEVDGNDLYCPGYYGVWIDSLSKYFEKIILIAHTSSVKSTYKIKSKNIEVIDLGVKPSHVFKRIFKFRSFQKIVLKNSHKFDCYGARIPTPLGAYLAYTVRNKPIFFLVVGNLWKLTMLSNMVSWKKYLLSLYWYLDGLFLSFLSRKAIVFANSDSYKNDYPLVKNIITVPTSTIMASDILYENKTLNNKGCKLLYLGRVAEEKGLEYLIEAVSGLIDAGFDVRLSIVGVEPGDESPCLQDLTEHLMLNKYIKFINYIEDQHDLKKILDDSDIMVIPSIWDSQPRSAWEGMSRGLPIIASTGVQSFKDSFVHKKDVYIIEPKKPNEIIKAVIEITSNPDLYSKLSTSSINIANMRTIEYSASHLVGKFLEKINTKY
jgi:glycosyltransferase involved in cell wall biosynthesis